MVRRIAVTIFFLMDLFDQKSMREEQDEAVPAAVFAARNVRMRSWGRKVGGAGLHANTRTHRATAK